jgi:predicted DNA-binding transcriptional regulator AlpA
MSGDNDDLIDMKEVCRELGGSKPVSPASVYRGIQKGLIDPPFHPIEGISRWSRGHIREVARRSRGGNGTK